MRGSLAVVIDERLAAAVSELASKDGGPAVVSAYLFGSVAAGREHRESDVDLGILLDWGRHAAPEDRFAQRLRFAAELPAAVGGREVDVVILNDAPPLLARAIVTKGRRIVCREPDLDHAFVRQALSRAADFEPWFRRMTKLKLEALRRS